MTTPHAPQNRVGSIRDLMLAGAITAVGLCGLWWFSSPSTHNDESWFRVMDVPVTLEPRLLLGQTDAPAVIVVASDFQCPFCAAFATKTLPQMRTELIETGRVSFYFRHFVDRTHRLAAPAATLAECAGSTGNFWRVHDQLFSAHRLLTEDVLKRLEDSLPPTDGTRGLCSEAPATVKEDTRWALQLGATGTPTFFFGKRIDDTKVLLRYAFGGARPLSDFRKLVDRLLD